ncbi:MAG: hypothetical protein SVK54_00495 [candidate division WOR-3 bacterium]|nr:hypothetical protein [candidate division WOR-3 bacterium]
MNKKNTEEFAKQTINLYERMRKSKLHAWTAWTGDDTFWIVFPNKVMYDDFIKFIDEPHEEIDAISKLYTEIGFIRIIWEEPEE